MPLRYKGSRRPDPRSEASIRVAQWVREYIGDDKGIAVGVSGSECGHAGCAGNDTIILLMRAGEQPRPIEMVVQTEIVDALSSIVAKVS